jgi:hypothetical protein
VFYGTAPNRIYGMLTAGHCREAFFDTPYPANRPIGRTHLMSPKVITIFPSGQPGYRWTDTQMIRQDGSRYQEKIWSGGAATTSWRWVRNGGNPSAGSPLYLGGGVSGDLRVQVDDVDRYVTRGDTMYGPGFYYRPQAGSDCAGREGDSGGSLFSVNPDDQSVTIRGMHVIGEGPDIVGACAVRGFAIRISTALSVGPGVGLVTQASGSGGY